ncbi:MAG: 16S rRNA (guanine(966)-N(2))-methyltransferase RsmD [Gammaproteobacteria bacterium]|nr:16S rRNA (guanine(966)-N(2))-methyltransferase RsmD [Gammaproteobacteria bacterium]
MSAGRGQQSLRIIAGQWRSRKIHFPDLPQLRPTPDRVRETLFNWLMPVIDGARCLDLFAGSGALGLEALSRGAAEVVFVDRDPKVVTYLRETLRLLKAEHAEVIQANALDYLAGAARGFDIVFLDPPYQSDVLLPCCQALESQAWLHPKAYIYIETASESPLPALPDNWEITREKTAGQVAYRLAQRT